jgi:peptidyl-prolyl cis-trans isomerase D
MLETMRRHASSWLLKTIFGLIVLSFIFFFGYQKINSKFQDNQQGYVARVGNVSIPRRKFENAYEMSLEKLRTSLKGELPENMAAFLKQNTLDQMIFREVVAEYGEKLGFTASDMEIADMVRSDPNLQIDGRFDLSFYEDKFLPRYNQAFGEDFENVVARQILIDKVQAFLPVLFAPWQKEFRAEATPIELFSPWINEFRDKDIKVEVY